MPLYNIGDTTVINSSYFFKSEVQRDAFFTDSANLAELETGDLIQVNVDNVATVFRWSGIDNPTVYSSDLFRPSTLGTSAASVVIGKDGYALSTGGRTLNLTDAYNQKYLTIANKFDDTGGEDLTYFYPAAFITIPFATVFDTTLSDPQEAAFVAQGDLIAKSFSVRPATTGTLRVKAYAGLTDSAPVIVDTETVVTVGDLGNILVVALDNDLVVENLDDTLVVFSGVQLIGGTQVNPPFAGLVKPFIEASISFPERRFIVDTLYLSTIILDSDTTITENGRSYGVDTSSNTVTLTVDSTVNNIRVFDLLKEFKNNSCFVDMGGDNFELDKKEKEYEFLNDGSTVHWFESGKKVK